MKKKKGVQFSVPFFFYKVYPILKRLILILFIPAKSGIHKKFGFRFLPSQE